MVSKAVATASQQASQKANDTAKATQDAQISGGKNSPSDNRGYNFSDTTGAVHSGNNPTQGAWTYDPKTGQSTGTLPSDVVQQQAVRIKQVYDEQIQQKYTKEMEVQKQAERNSQILTNASLQANNQAKANQDAQISGAKNSMYDNRGYDYSSTADPKNPDDKFSHGANPKNITPDNPTGSWIKDKVTGEEYKTTEESDKALGQYTPKGGYKKDTFSEMVSPQSSDSVKSNNPLNDSQNKNTFVDKTDYSEGKKVRVSDTFSKMLSADQVDQQNKIIENKNKIIENNNKIIQQENKKSVDEFLGQGKDLGFKQVQIKSSKGVSTVDINDSNALLGAESNAEFSFIKTPEMRKQGQDIRKEQKKFLLDSKNMGSELLIKTETKNGMMEKTIVPIKDGYREMINSPSATFSNVPLIPKGYAVAGEIGKNILVSTEKPQEIKPDYSSDIVSKNVKNWYEYDPYKPDEKIQGAKKPDIFEKGKFVVAQAGAEVVGSVTGGYEMIRNAFRNKKDQFDSKSSLPTVYDFAKSTQLLLNLPSKQTFVPDTVPTRIITAPLVSASESNTFGDFTNKTSSSFNEAIIFAQKQPLEKNLGQGIGFFGSFVSPTKYVKALPVRYTNLMVLDNTAQQISLGKIISLGYESKKSLSLGGLDTYNKPFIGKINPENTGYTRIGSVSGKNSFETFELANFSPLREKLIKPTIEYGETKGHFVKGEFQDVFNRGRTMQKAGETLPFDKYTRKTLDVKELELKEGMIGESFTSNISQSQKNKWIDNLKGSFVWNLVKGGIKTKAGDIDTDALGKMGGTKSAELVSTSKVKQGYEYKQSNSNVEFKKIEESKGDKVFNAVTEKEQLIDVIGFKINKNRDFFGHKQFSGSVDVDLVENSVAKSGKKSVLNPKGGFTNWLGNKLTFQFIPKQIEDVSRSTSGVLGKNTAKGYKGITPEVEKNLFPEKVITRFGFPLLHRQKDAVRNYFWGMRETARIAFLEGNKKMALDIGLSMQKEYKKYQPIFNWREEITKVKNTGSSPIDLPSKKLSSSYFTKVKQNVNFGNIGSLGTRYDSTQSKEKNKQTTVNKIYSSKSQQSKSSNSISTMFSPKSIIKVESSKSLSSMYSPKSMVSSGSVSSIGSTKSMASMYSPKSMVSPSSSLTKSPSTKSPSILSPSIKSLSTKSPSITSPSIKSPSILSPSIKSPSTKSPSITSPSIKFPSLTIPPTTSPPQILIPKFGFDQRHKKTYRDVKKPSITFRWNVINPIFKKFSIIEGKKGKVIEW